jgi:hypothetical protein
MSAFINSGLSFAWKFTESEKPISRASILWFLPSYGNVGSYPIGSGIHRILPEKQPLQETPQTGAEHFKKAISMFKLPGIEKFQFS